MMDVMDLGKWAEQTAQAVRRICEQQEAPCVGFSLIFFDPLAEKDKQWGYVIELAFDPNNPPEEKERAEIQTAFEFINEGVRRIMGGEKVDDNIVNYISHGTLQ
jgi:hypothetical protein